MNQLSNTKRATPRSTKKANHYVNNAAFQKAIIEHKKKVALHEEQGLQPPQIPHYIGECLYQIANNLSKKYNFVNYTFRDEMVGDAIENCILYFNNYDPSKYNNPFAYYTQIMWFAFLRRIQEEKDQLYTKHKVLQKDIIHRSIVEMQVGESWDKISDYSGDNEFMNNFVEEFEKKLSDKKAANKMNSSNKRRMKTDA